jgi:hypothetical protein
MCPIDFLTKHTLQAKAIIITTAATRTKPEAEHVSLEALSNVS